ncbi:hypothetical protein [Epilithonimonas hungarica]|uniref:Uncharacterized protein n=1 Tax=Epilithonimonas hungarica TaxID=454006 RepID=A0A1G7UEQ8_9FLAO|nr:hypothetical protein [Epilithonimonas hungarica]SDG45798.1 hypothetical protein SAMN05421825_3412 [Epilithonimonas hungarica]
MKSKPILTILLTAIVFFALGFLGKDFYQNKSKSENIPVTKNQSDRIQTKDETKTENKNTDFSKVLKGKYILEGADYAGFEFIDDETISWTNEMFPMDPDTMRLKWIDEHTFVTTFTKNIEKGCPPRNWVRKIESYDGHKLVIRDYWTGWGESKDESEVFYKE